MKRKTMVLGASTAAHRYSFLAAKKLLSKGFRVILVGKSAGEIEGNKILKTWPENEEIDTITMYLAPQNQTQFYNNILTCGARRIIFNPGTENPELEHLAREKGIVVEEACTLVLLSINQY